MSQADPYAKNFRVVALSGELTVAEKAVYNVLLAYSWRTGDCYPSHERIARQAPCSVRAVPTHLAWLEEIGLITVRRRARGHGNRYQVHPLTPELKARLNGNGCRSRTAAIAA